MRFSLLLWAGLCCFSVAAQPRITVGPSETTELMSVIMHLSGNRAYDQKVIWPEYRALVDSIFAPHRGHRAVVFARDSIYATDLPMFMAVNARIRRGRVGLPFPDLYVDYYTPGEHEEWAAAIGDFYRETGFGKVYETRLAPLYDRVKQPLEERYNAVLDLDWLADFTGDKRPAAYFVTLCYLNGNNCYGCYVGDRPRPVMGVGDVAGEGVYSSIVLLHEYLHPWLNPLVDSRMDDFEAAGHVIFPPIIEKVWYSTWDAVVREALINASVAVYMRERGLPAGKWIDDCERAGFYWVDRLAVLLSEYQKQRDKYPTLESFMLEVVKFYDDLAAKVAQ